MKLISWNVNGLRACIQKGFLEQFDKLNADFFCLQETKLQEGQLQLELPGYEQYWCYAEKKGYSGTAIFTKHTPLSVSYGLGVAELDTEGRLITLEYPEFYLVTCYTPNAQRELARIDHRMKWDAAFRNYISALDAKKPTIICGDLNVAHQEIDLKNPGSNRGNAGFSDQERSSFTETLALGFTDTFRYLNPNTAGAYTWWSYMFHAREKNAGWRIDYFLVSDRLKDSVYNTPIYSDILGSDHCPVGLEIDLSCNGSIWSAEPQGKAKVIAPAEKPATKPANIKAIATCAMVCAVFGIGLLAAHTFSDTEAPAVSGSKDLSTANTFPEETLDTAALLKEVSSIGELTGIYIGAADTADFEAKYAELKTRYPALGELKSRENAATALLNRYLYLGASSNIQELQQRPVIEALLSLDFYQQQLTAEEQKTFLTFRRYVLYVPGEEPEISAEEAKAMSTGEIVSHIIGNTDFQKFYNLNGFICTEKYYPVLTELTEREDAATVLLAQQADPYGIVTELLGCDEILGKMTMEEKAVYICSFLSINSEVFPPLTAEEAAETSTERLVANCISNGKLRFQLGYCTALQPYDCGDLALFALVYDLDIQDNPALAELERREDAVSELLLFFSHTSNAETSKLAMIILSLDVYQEKMTADELTQYASWLDTETLIKVTLLHDSLYAQFSSSPVLSSPDSELMDPFHSETCVYLRELAARENAQELLEKYLESSWNIDNSLLYRAELLAENLGQD